MSREKAKHGLPCLVAAVTGRSGSGKSTVSAHYAALGYPVLDADQVARAVTQVGSPCLAQLAKAFGADVLDESGALLRERLAARAFAGPEETKRLTQITHPAIIAQLLEGASTAAQAGAPLVFVDGAVIVGEAFEPYCDLIVVVDAPEREALLRIVLRDGVSKQAARNRLTAQLPRTALLQAADYVVRNDASKETLLARADAALRQLCVQHGLPPPAPPP